MVLLVITANIVFSPSELVSSEDPLLSYVVSNQMDALLAVEITPNKEYLLCFDGKFIN